MNGPTAGYESNVSNANYMAYLFATLPNVSKVGTYIGSVGATQTINAGFTSSARFILIKRIDQPGEWYMWDTARGINAGSNEPHIALSGTSGEGSADSIDPDSTGFVVKQNGTTNINVSG